MRLRHVLSACVLASFFIQLGSTPRMLAADEFIAPSPAEREAVAALVAKGAMLRIDAAYRVTNITLLGNSSDDDLKLVAPLKDITSVQLSSSKITDAALEYLK